MKRWWVVCGSSSWWFDDLNEAKHRARKFYASAIFEVFNDKHKFLRYEMKGERLCKV